MKTIYVLGLFALTLIFGLTHIHEASAKIYQNDGYAVSGYDVVSYFNMHKAVKGSDDYVTEYKGAKWRFSSSENLKFFKDNPEKYVPQYGGYCAYAAAKDKLAKSDPEQWTIYNNKLYMNYSKSIRQDWEKDKDGYITKADKNWPDLRTKEKKSFFDFN